MYELHTGKQSHYAADVKKRKKDSSNLKHTIANKMYIQQMCKSGVSSVNMKKTTTISHKNINLQMYNINTRRKEY